VTYIPRCADPTTPFSEWHVLARAGVKIKLGKAHIKQVQMLIFFHQPEREVLGLDVANYNPPPMHLFNR
jgi:hypothetical protein